MNDAGYSAAMPDASERVLVVGGGGFLGRALVAQLGGSWAVDAPSSAELDIAEPGAVARWMAVRPAVAVLNAACRQPGSPASDLERVNVIGADAVARAAHEANARLIHMSTDVVLDGRHAPYADDAAACPVNSYGRSKAAGEAAVLAAHRAAVCVRTSLIWDPNEMDRSTVSFAERLARGESCRLFTDEVRCPISRVTLAAALCELVGLSVRGTLNVAGAEALTREAFGRMMLQHFAVDGADRVESGRAADLPSRPGEARPADLTLDVSLASRMLSTPLHGVTDELRLARRTNG